MHGYFLWYIEGLELQIYEDFVCWHFMTVKLNATYIARENTVNDANYLLILFNPFIAINDCSHCILKLGQLHEEEDRREFNTNAYKSHNILDNILLKCIQWTLSYPDTFVPKLTVWITEYPDKRVTFYIDNHNNPDKLGLYSI